MKERPNILLIVVHDLGTYLGCYGNQSVCSPNLDALAVEGVRFENHFATACFCSPSRGSIITGKYPNSHGLLGLVNLGWNLPKENTTMAQMLGSAGYETYLFGLQHEVKDVSQLGYQHVPPVPSVLCADTAPVVIDFMKKRSGNNDRPFYVHVGFAEVHRHGIDGYTNYKPYNTALVKLPIFLKDTRGARLDIAQFHTCIREMDKSVGDILKALDESGLKDNTIVVFTTDHGIDFPGAKGTLYDPGINTTLIMRWPNGMSGGKVYSELLSNIDLLPTLLEATEVFIPQDIEGRSFLSLLQGKAYSPNEMIFAEKNTIPDDLKRCVRTDRWKYIHNFDEGPMLALATLTETSLTRRDMGDDHLRPRPEVELYDLKTDPLEHNNLAGSPKCRKIEQDLETQLRDWMKKTNDPVLNGGIERPLEEAEIIRRSWEEIRKSR